ncbi:unnamed protein product [Effrenium voratum]|uniref:Cyclic nucleotide-binding domain-containing protein n=1 Tax=Effrenium voratum TaxID=2562239 RepID=A0AA36I6J8_9DINO|nr:unnamed protein product [Effrenium voratum]CAJ1456122.1 unnamed protein product [Effrenium voratum]
MTVTVGKRLSVQIVPGEPSESDEHEEKEQALPIPRSRGGSATPSPRSKKGGDSTRDQADLSTLISRKSIQKSTFHRFSIFASVFDLRAAVPADEVPRLLDRHGTHYIVQSAEPEGCCAWTSKWSLKLASWARGWARQELVIHPLCFLSLLVGPFMLAFESTCADGERLFILCVKIFHLVCTSAYLVFAVIHFISSPLNPWPALWKARSFRFRLLSHKAENLHPALVQQLHARGGPATDHSQAEAASPIRSLRFWVPVFDFIVFLSLIAEIINLWQRPARIDSFIHWAWLLVLAKGFRLLVPPSEFVPSNLMIDGLVLGMWLFVVIHLCSCLLSLASVLQVQRGSEDAWAAPELLEPGGSSCRRFYMLSWYYTSTTVTSIGYGDITPKNSYERLFASGVMIFSQLYFAKVFADLTFLTSMYNQWTLQRHQRMTQTKSALESMNIPKTLIQRVQACQAYVWDVQKERRAKNCFEDLTSQLQEEVKLVLYSRLVIQVPFLQMVDARALRFLIGRLQDQVFLPADFIICRGDIGNEMFFLREGFAGVFTCTKAPHWEDEEIKKVEKGSHFGEIALLTGQLRTAWIMARVYCLTSVLQGSAIDNLMAQDPTSICSLIKNFQDMLKLKPSLHWPDLKQRLNREFDPDDSHRHELYDFVCSGDDGLAPAGLITWTRYQVLLSRIQVSQLDQKLLWAELDEEQCGSVSFEHFVETVYGQPPMSSDDESDAASTRSPLKSVSIKSGRAGMKADADRKDSLVSNKSSKSSRLHSMSYRSKSMYRGRKGKMDSESALLHRMLVLEEKLDVLMSVTPGAQSHVLENHRLQSGRPSIEVHPPQVDAMLSLS